RSAGQQPRFDHTDGVAHSAWCVETAPPGQGDQRLRDTAWPLRHLPGDGRRLDQPHQAGRRIDQSLGHALLLGVLYESVTLAAFTNGTLNIAWFIPLVTKNALDSQQVKQMLLAIAERIIAAEPMLSEADRHLGDGDHGLGMARGLAAVKAKLDTNAPESI